MIVLGVIQARMGSSRLPGKIMKEIKGIPMIGHVCSRVEKSSVDKVIVATTQLPEDDVVEAYCQKRGWDVFRGSSDDVLDRYYQTALNYFLTPFDGVVRVTADCPLIDPDIIDLCIKKMKKDNIVDYITNCFPLRTFPRGLDVGLVRFGVLKRVRYKAFRPPHKEHVTKYITDYPTQFVIKGLTYQEDYSHLRLTVDEQVDFDLVQEVINRLPEDFRLDDIINLYKEDKELFSLNSHVIQR